MPTIALTHTLISVFPPALYRWLLKVGIRMAALTALGLAPGAAVWAAPQSLVEPALAAPTQTSISSQALTQGLDRLHLRHQAAQPRVEQFAQSSSASQALPPTQAAGLLITLDAGFDVVPTALLDALQTLGASIASPPRLLMERTWIVPFTQPIDTAAFAELAQALSQRPDVSLVEGDWIVQIQSGLIPNDPLWPEQWNLMAPSQFAGGLNLPLAWTRNTGSASVVIAVVDTGILPHPDLSGRVLPGFDFISDPAMAGDGDGRDANPRDEGDAVSLAEAQAMGCAVQAQSSWHGTFVSALAVAPGNDAAGMAGVAWQSRLLPVRALGKCGGRLSDILEGVRWAAGLPVSGVPNNPHPARVINLSLGVLQPSGCPASWARTLAEVRLRGTAVVVAAGNDSADASFYVPASCPGVFAVGATSARGLQAIYSNYSLDFGVLLSAPGGDVIRDGSRFAIRSASDSGSTRPVGPAYRLGQGTSYSAPHVSGLVALALAADPRLSPSDLELLLLVSARAFPAGSLCDRFWPLCGAGLADADATLSAVEILRPFRIAFEYRNTQTGRYFRTADRNGPAFLDTGAVGPWELDGDAFLVWDQPAPGLAPVCRFYSERFLSHFYTANADECELVKRNADWRYEQIEFYVSLPNGQGQCASATAPVHRYFNNRHREGAGNHRFTTAPEVVGPELLSAGWTYEGIVFCVPG